MSRAAARDNAESLSLFPFLAVLLCTMGALVILLVGLAKTARDRVAKQQAAVEQASLAQITSAEATAKKLAEIRTYTAQLAIVRSTAEQRLRENQSRLTHLEDHMRRLKDELGTLQIAAMELEGMANEHEDDRELARSELARIQGMVREAEARIEQLQEEQHGQGKSYAIVPYEGNNGTFRPTIYIECREDKVILQPEGVELTAADFLGPMGAGNPLASAMRAAKEYMRQQSGSTELDVEPYPLILVRPDGIDAYFHVRRAIRGWEADFGYELIDGDWNLTYPAANPELARWEHRAIEEARARQRELARAAPEAFVGYNASFDIGDEELGGAEGESYATSGTGTSTGSGHDGQAGQTGQPGTEGIHGGVAGSTNSGESTLGGTESVPLDGSPKFSQGPELANPSTSEEGQFGGSGGPGLSGPDGSESSPALDKESFDSQLASNGANGTPGASSSPNAGGNGGTGAAPASAQAGAASATSGTNPSGAGAASTDTQQAAGGAPTNVAFASQQPGATATVSNRDRGQDWAIRDSNPGNIAIRRTVDISVQHDQLAIIPERATTRAKQTAPASEAVPISANQRIPVDRFVSSLWKHMEQWGMAGNGLYWKPVLVLHVAPGAEQRAAELTQLLHNSGVEIRTNETAQHHQGSDHATIK